MPRASLPDRAKIVLMPKHPSHEPIVDDLTQSRDVLQAAVVDRMTPAGNKILLAGNGGGAGHARHISATHIVCGLVEERLLPCGKGPAGAAE